MTDPRFDLPEFVAAALEGEADVPAFDDQLSVLLDTVEPAAALKSRLLGAVELPPMRYAPFFSRVAELFDLREEQVEREFARLRDPKIWRPAGLPGVRNVEVKGGPKVADAETLFVRFAPGTYFPAHDHTGLERVLVLEGSYTDSGGVNHKHGELREWQPGSQHSFRVSTSEPCIFASVVHGRRFQAWPLRALAKVLGR